MLIAFAIIGWLLFLVAVFFLWIGTKANAKDVNALQFFFLAVLASEEYWKMNQEECKEAFSKMADDNIEQKKAIQTLLNSLLTSGKRAMVENLQITMRATKSYFLSE